MCVCMYILNPGPLTARALPLIRSSRASQNSFRMVSENRLCSSPLINESASALLRGSSASASSTLGSLRGRPPQMRLAWRFWPKTFPWPEDSPSRGRLRGMGFPVFGSRSPLVALYISGCVWLSIWVVRIRTFGVFGYCSGAT